MKPEIKTRKVLEMSIPEYYAKEPAAAVKGTNKKIASADIVIVNGRVMKNRGGEVFRE